MEQKTRHFRAVLLVLVVLLVLLGTVGIVYAASTTTPTATMAGDLTFVPDSGIRYNAGLSTATENVFEIYNYAGLTWMNSGKTISTIGEVSDAAESSTAKKAIAGTSMGTIKPVYYIMQDIYYQDTVPSSGNSAYLTTYSVNFYGTLDGRGFYLRNFKTRETSSTAGNLSILNINNNGNIRNINIENVTIIGTSTTAKRNISFLCLTNWGKIENCTTYGTVIYGNTTSGNVYFGTISLTNGGTIKNCTNNLSIDGTKLTTSAAGNSYVSGIVSYPTGALCSLANNVNNGNLTATSSACGIVCYYFNGQIGETCNNNINNGEIVAANGHAYDLYYGYEKGYEDLGIRWNLTTQVFEISSYKGFTYIGSDAQITIYGSEYYYDGDSPTSNQAAWSANYVLMNDIYYDAKTGRADNPFYGGSFSGILDGKGYSLINFETKGGYSNTASILFYEISGSIKNLTIENPKLVSYDSVVEFGLFAYVLNGGTLDNCKTSGIIGYTDASIMEGSIAGFCYNAYDSTIINCQNGLNLDDQIGYYTASGISGIVFSADGIVNIINCTNKGNIISRSNASGFIDSASGILNIENCQNLGIITTTGGGFAAGFINYSSDTVTLTNNINYGKIISSSTGNASSIGGFLASAGNGTVTLNGNKNYGNITMSYTDTSENLGGMIGCVIYSTAILRNNINRGTIEGGTYAGGMIGYADSSSSISFNNNINYGEVKAKTYVGGIIGSLESSMSTNWKPITNNINYGAITSTAGGVDLAFTAGIIGFLYYQYAISSTYPITGNINYGVIRNNAIAGTATTDNTSCGIAGGSIISLQSSWNTYANQNFNYGQIYSGGSTSRYSIFARVGTSLVNGGI